MKITILFALIIGTFSFNSTTFASGELNSVLKGETKKQSTKKRRRRKKAEMCQECGKPEVQCECEGHGHKNEKGQGGHDNHGH